MKKYIILLLISLIFLSGCTYTYNNRDADNCEEIYNKLIGLNQTNDIYYEISNGNCVIRYRYAESSIFTYANTITINLNQYNKIKTGIEEK